MPATLYRSRFFGLPSRQVCAVSWRLGMKRQEAVRGLIRGVAARERLLHPSAARAMQRRIRLRLVRAYVRRFGDDAFAAVYGARRLARPSVRRWLTRGYAHWRGRYPRT
ncbi:MAG: hypothetical protein HZB72_06200 [Burkholderiales bacterium]|nr:hypothetical protein [Burkholderiales bacterium]